MQADPRRGHINPSRPHGQLPHSSLTVYDSTLAIKGGSCIFGCFGAGDAGGLPPHRTPHRASRAAWDSLNITTLYLTSSFKR